MPGCNILLHTHPLLQTVDIYGHGKPTRIAHAHRDVRELDKKLLESELLNNRSYFVPWFKYLEPGIIDQYVDAFEKVSANYAVQSLSTTRTYG